VQATILTPFPGTELFQEMSRSGRLVEKGWEHYDFSHVVFEPQQMSRQTLQDGHDWLSVVSTLEPPIASAPFRELGYLCPSTILAATARSI